MILVLNSPLFRYRNDKYDEDSLPPIGLGYIATELKLAGYKVDLIDAVALNLSIEEVISIVNTVKPSFLAMNIFTTNQELVKEVVDKINFECKFIIGGLSTKDIYKDILNWVTSNPIDVVIGDGERIILDIVSEELKCDPFLAEQKKRVFKVDTQSPYYVKDISSSKLDRSFFVNEPVEHPFGFSEANIVTSRGCIYNCAFCAAARSENSDFGIREASVESIRDEIENIRNSYRAVNSIRVLDDLFLKTNKSVDRAIKIFENTGFEWRSMAHVMTFNRVEDRTMIALRDSGCNELFIGVESGSPNILKRIHKTHNIEVIKRNLISIMRAGISIKAYFIYGFPGETGRDMELTYKLAKYLKRYSLKYGVSFRVSVFQFRPYHGTELYHELDSANLIDRDVKPIEPNTELSELIGRLQFNFHSGNYSLVDSDRLHDYICRTTKLNSGRFFEAITKHKP